MSYSQQRLNVSVVYLRFRAKLSYNQIAEVLSRNVKTVYEKVQRVGRHGVLKTFENFDNRRLPDCLRRHYARAFYESLGLYRCIWSFIHGLCDTIEQALAGYIRMDVDPP